MPALELKVPPLALFVIAMALAWLIAGQPQAFLWTSVLVGGVLAAVGAAVAIAGVVQFRKARTTVDPMKPERAERLVTNGIYGRTRNPMYLGLAAILAGWIIVLGNIWAGIVLPAFVDYLTRFQIEPEERILRQRFGAAFDAYASRVRRWI